VTDSTKLDYRLFRAIRRGPGELPGDLDTLRGYLRTIAVLLHEKATEVEPTWEEACAATAEIAALQSLEATVAERAIGVRARSLDEVRAKLAIWRALGPGAQDDEPSAPRNRLILSVEADLARLAAPRCAPQRAD
jgi:hypothetical protein